MNIVDSHCHLYYDPFILDLNKHINECLVNNVNILLSIGVDYETSKKNTEISKLFDQVYCTIGLHPNNVLEKFDELDRIFSLYKISKKIIGIGECGIDLYRSKDNLFKQNECFERQIQFSIENNLPFVVHSRDSEEETFSILNSFKNKNMKFVIHCFSGSEKFANQCIDLGGYISFSGIITFKNAEKLQKVFQNIPLNKILAETDSPYLSPHPYRGKKNHPKNVIHVLKKMSEIKKIEFNEVACITFDNFKRLFKI